MKSRKAFIVAATLVVALSFAWFATAGHYDTPAAMRGVKAIRVEMLGLEADGDCPGLKAIGLTPMQIITTVELRLRTLGLPVVNEDDGEGHPPLKLAVTAHVISYSEEPVSACSLALEVYQEAMLIDEHVMPVTAVTWSRRSALIHRPAILRELILKHLPELVDDFANAYLVQNPRTPTTQPSAPGK